MSCNRYAINGVAAALGLTATMYCGVARCQSPAPAPQPATAQPITTAPQPAAPAGAIGSGTLALPAIAEPQRLRAGDGRPTTANLFAQERDSFDQVKEAQTASATARPLAGTPQPVLSGVAAPSVSDAELLRQAGVVLGSPNTGRLVVERVMPNSAALAAGVRAGDVIARIDRTAVVVSNPLRPAGVTGGATIGLDINRGAQTGRLILNMPEPIITRTAQAPAPMLRSTVAPVTTPSGRVIETGAAAAAAAPLDHATTAQSKVTVPGSGSTTGPGVAGTGDTPQGPGTPGLGSAPAEGGGSAAMRTGRNAPVKPGQGFGPGRLP